MVRAPTAGPSRPASSRGGSVARDILKKREKPYKTEFQKVVARKRKLNINTSYTDAPEGYTFLPVGTPDLADLCKRLSKQRDFPVNVVNAKPTSRVARDPTKLSHHVHRIGYHFHSEVIEQAAAELHYTYHKGCFVREADLAKKRLESAMAQTLLRHGVRMQDASTQESPAQVRGAIKELFPKIPDDDLEEIVKHAWAEGTTRVGNAQMLDLPRRVQLAVIARIRHKYTDYDRLLRAFEWTEARKMTEPVSLQKLIEWRGEQDVEDDNELEEMVRETIVIPDDDDEILANGSEADDEDSSADQGEHSDASIEVTHHLADDTDIGGESTYEDLRRPLYRRFQQVPRRSERQHNMARQKLAEARQQMQRDGVWVPRTCNIDVVHVPQGRGGTVPSSFVQAGVVYRAVPETQTSRQPPPQQAFVQSQQQGLFPSRQAPQDNFISLSNHAGYQTDSAYAPPQDRPVASIERVFKQTSAPTSTARGQASKVGVTHARPVTPDSEHSSKRRRVDDRTQHLPPGKQSARLQPANGDVIDLTTPQRPRQRAPLPFHGQVVDLSTPEPAHQPFHPSPLREVKTNAAAHRHSDVLHYQNSPSNFARLQQGQAMQISTSHQIPLDDNNQSEAESLAYDPTHPMLLLPRQVDRLSIHPDSNSDQRFHSMPGAWPRTPPDPPPPSQQRFYYEVPQQTLHPHPSFQPLMSAIQPAPPPRIMYEHYQSRPTPQPVHGAPAPVQVVPRPVYPVHTYGRSPTVPPPLPPTNGAPAPAQYVPR